MARNKVRVKGIEILSAASLLSTDIFVYTQFGDTYKWQLENRDPRNLTPVRVFSINCTPPSPPQSSKQCSDRILFEVRTVLFNFSFGNTPCYQSWSPVLVTHHWRFVPRLRRFVPTFDQFVPNPLDDSYPTNYDTECLKQTNIICRVRIVQRVGYELVESRYCAFGSISIS